MESPIVQPVVQEKEQEVQKEEKKTNYLVIALVILLCSLVSGIGGYYLGYQSKKEPVPNQAAVPSPVPTEEAKKEEPLPTEVATDSSKATPTVVQENGASLNDIKYVLPQNWEAKFTSGGINFAPLSGGGYLFLKVYDYQTSLGRREYYCKTTGFCTQSTYYDEVKIGNISGYKADSLDNSGGGPEYFGAKGNKFYIISSYSPPSPNDFEKGYKSVLNSLVF